MKLYHYKHHEGQGNFGDELSPVLVEHFTGKVERAEKEDIGKLLAVGSIIAVAQEGDVIWGSGLIADVQMRLPQVEVLALRGPLTALKCRLPCNVYGDPGLLMPLLFYSKVDKIYKRGYVPHYVDQEEFKKRTLGKDELFINVLDNWQEVITQILQCKEIVSSSLHGIVLAEAYGIPAIYQPSYTGKIIGGDFKFRDYLLGTGRSEEDLKKYPIPQIEDLKMRQHLLIKALKDYTVTKDANE